LDFMGRNFTVDAACASSLIATEIAIQDLESGKEDIVLAGGVHIFAHIPFLQVFDAMRALSMSSTIRPYDEHADGTIAGEGVGILVLKRLTDAERDGDRIYAVIRGAGSSSDGRAKGVTAPRVEGEEAALRRAYENSEIPPHTIELIEGHGTGTPVGDAVELEALGRVFGTAQQGRPFCALGSVKSMIGHAMPAAGAAGLIKTALSLYHRVLPPTLHCGSPRAQLLGPESPIYVNTETRPWIHSQHGAPRRAGVNAFGFGGVNAHIVLEEYRGASESEQPILHARWDSELVVLQANDRAGLVEASIKLAGYCEAKPDVELRDIAYTLNTRAREGERLAIVASSLEDLSTKLRHAAGLLGAPACTQIKDRQGIYYFADSSIRGGKIAFLFPGEGSQYLNMLSDVCIHFPEVRQAFDLADSAVHDPERWPPSAIIFPPPLLSPQETAAAEGRLFTIDRATEAVLTADAAMLNLLSSLQLEPDMMVGHSAGEWIAMAAAGVLQESEFFRSFEELSRMYARVAADTSVPRMSMLAVGGSGERVQTLVAEIGREVHIANDNCPHQVVAVVSATDEAPVIDHLQKHGLVVERLPYDRGYHTPAFTYICEPLRSYFSTMQIREPRKTLYSCSTASHYPSDPREILDLVSETFARPLYFRQTIDAMYEAGARVFVEVGPRGGLTAFVDDILRGREHMSVAMDQQRRPGILALNHALAMLEAQHVPLNLDTLYVRRQPRLLTFDPQADRMPHPDSAPGVIQISTCYPRLQPPVPVERKSAARSHPGVTWETRVRIEEHQPAPLPPAAVVTPAHGNGGDHSQVMKSHFALMEQFLETQEIVMRQFMSPDYDLATTEPVPAAVHSGQLESAFGAVPIAMPEPVAVATALTLPEAVSAPSEPGPLTSSNNLEAVLLKIVSDRTGYPAEMLGLDLDMEADLGIDSIKRIEVLAAIKEVANGAGPGEQAMEEIAKLKTLRQVLAMLSPVDGTAPAVEFPFTRSAELVSHQAGQRIELRCSIDPAEHLYLADHCLYFAGSEYGRQGAPVLSMPLTGSMEIMAEAAARLSPGQKVIGFKDMQAGRWMNVDQGGAPITLSIAAEFRDASNIRVAIRSGNGKSGDLLAECTVVVGNRFPELLSSAPLTLKNARPPQTTGRGIYTEHRMFHGPSFQGVLDLDLIGEDGVSGTLEVLPAGKLFRSDPNPRMQIDPFLLDAAGQMVGYWPVE
ncbi:MAG: beta-ketoacyl synthase, partial [Bryobacterales bacterium]|nr:beta-ketoacyl synthase [Bryobacterales bacterium]